jgi:hypothetical protein
LKEGEDFSVLVDVVAGVATMVLVSFLVILLIFKKARQSIIAVKMDTMRWK